MRFWLGVALLALSCATGFATGEGDEEGAAPGMMPIGGMLVFYQTTGPMSFVAMTPRDVPKFARSLGTVRGVSCQRGLSIPLAASLNATSVSGGYGDGGYAKALSAIKREHPDLAGIYDVKTDVAVFSILGIYRSLCTEVTARGFATAGSAKP